MSERNEYELGGAPEEPIEPSPEPPDEEPGLPIGLIAATVGVVVVAAVIVALILSGRKPAPSPTPVASAAPSTVAPSPSPEATPEPEPIVLPPLDASDSFVQQLAAKLSSNPQLAAWLATEGLARRFVAVVDNIAAGESPAPHLGVLAPEGRFQVAGGAQPYVIDPRSYDRYDGVADVVASLDAQGCARLFTILEPLFVEAYRELGYPNASFRKTFDRALARLLATPVLEGEVALTPAVLSYRYADPRLEALSPAEKHLLRMGPRNVRRVQAKLREMSSALESATPPPDASPAASAPEAEPAQAQP